MTNVPFAVGGPVEARCTTCRRITNHTVVSMIGKKPAKILCNTCKGEHSYRSPDVGKKSMQRAAGALTAEWQEWADQLPGTKSDNARDYSMDGDYKVGAVIRHPSFGLGLVQRVVGNRKIEVLFTDGKKTMRCR